MAVPDFFAGLARVGRGVARAVTSFTQTFNPSATGTVLAAPTYRDHLQDLLTVRQGQSSNEILSFLFKNDPDVSAAVASYLTLADTPVRFLVYDAEGQIDPAATAELHKIVRALTTPTDYTRGFQAIPDLKRLCQELRYMVLLRGAVGGELILGRNFVPERLQLVDMVSIEWFEPTAGVFKPRQRARSTGQFIDLDIPNFFVSYHRRDPTRVYSESDFVSAINTIAARTQVLNDLYRIMRMTGFPRIDVEVLEEVVRKNMPSNVAADPDLAKGWLSARLQEIGDQVANLRADQPIFHFDSVKLSILNEDNPASGLKIAEVIEALNSMNQAGLKSMATILGRAKSGTNTASVEARIAAMNADQLNRPVAELLGRVFTFLLNLYGIAGFVEAEFEPAELRPHLELEPQRVMRAARLREDLSLGIITDAEYHLMMYGRLPPAGSPQLSGTNFMENTRTSVDAEGVTPNGDPLGRSVAPEGGTRQARSNATRSQRQTRAALELLDAA
jgi:hypothetical protein